MAGKEVIGVHVGNAGTGIGAAMWDLLRREHKIMDSGYLVSGITSTTRTPTPNTMFYPLTPERYFCRAVFLDTDPYTLDLIASSPQSRLFLNRSLVTGKEPGKGNFSAAKLEGEQEIVPSGMERIRKQVEITDGSPEGFLVTHGMAGGAGSGLTAEMLNRLSEEYPKSKQTQLAIFPNQEIKNESCLNGFYNTGLMLKNTLSDLRTVILVDNSALHNLIKSCTLRPENSYSNASANHLLAHVASALTACSRFNGSSPLMFSDFEQHLVPTRLLRFSTAAITPMSEGCRCHGVQPEKMETSDVVTGCFNPRVQLNSAATVKGEPNISSSLVFRGPNSKDAINKSIHHAVNQYDVRFGKGVRPGFKVGLAETAPALVPFEEHRKANTSAALFNNTTSLSKPFSYLKEVIKAMLGRRANLHHYYQYGEEPEDFAEAVELLEALLSEYKSYGGFQSAHTGQPERKRNWNYTHGVQGDVYNCNNVSELRQYACKCYRCYNKSPCPMR